MVAAAILWSILPRRDRFEAPGPQLLPDDYPRLLREVEVIAQQMGQAMPRDVYLTPEVNAWVMERAGMLGIGNRRVMALGLPLLQMLTVSQLHGVIAHEFGHFYNGDTRLAPWVYQMRGRRGHSGDHRCGADGCPGGSGLGHRCDARYCHRLTSRRRGCGALCGHTYAGRRQPGG